MALTFIDLGLPSGTLWATENAAVNGKTYFNFDEAIEAFGDMLPSAEAWKELFNQCSRKWNKRRKGYVLTGPNGNTLSSRQKAGNIGTKKPKNWTATSASTGPRLHAAWLTPGAFALTAASSLRRTTVVVSTAFPSGCANPNNHPS